MTKLEELLIRYETARQLVTKLKAKHSNLLAECDGISLEWINDGCYRSAVEVGITCGRKAWADMNEEEGDDISFEDSFFIYINDEKGACEKCKSAYSLKYGELAVANKELGISKRLLSHFGKKLMAVKQ